MNEIANDTVVKMGLKIISDYIVYYLSTLLFTQTTVYIHKMKATTTFNPIYFHSMDKKHRQFSKHLFLFVLQKKVKSCRFGMT